MNKCVDHCSGTRVLECWHVVCRLMIRPQVALVLWLIDYLTTSSESGQELHKDSLLKCLSLQSVVSFHDEGLVWACAQQTHSTGRGHACLEVVPITHTRAQTRPSCPHSVLLFCLCPADGGSEHIQAKRFVSGSGETAFLSAQSAPRRKHYLYPLSRSSLHCNSQYQPSSWEWVL